MSFDLYNKLSKNQEIETQEKLELSTSYPQKVDNFTLTITFHIDVWVNPQLAEMLIFLEIFNILA